MPLWGLFKSKLNSSRKVFTECIKKHIPLHYLLSDTNNCKTQSISGHKLVMEGNTPLVPVSRNRLEAAAEMLVLIMSPAPGTSPRGFWTCGRLTQLKVCFFSSDRQLAVTCAVSGVLQRAQLWDNGLREASLAVGTQVQAHLAASGVSSWEHPCCFLLPWLPARALRWCRCSGRAVLGMFTTAPVWSSAQLPGPSFFCALGYFEV